MDICNLGSEHTMLWTNINISLLIMDLKKHEQWLHYQGKTLNCYEHGKLVNVPHGGARHQRVQSHKMEYITCSHMPQWLIIAQCFFLLLWGQKDTFLGYRLQTGFCLLCKNILPTVPLEASTQAVDESTVYWAHCALINRPSWCLGHDRPWLYCRHRPMFSDTYWEKIGFPLVHLVFMREAF